MTTPKKPKPQRANVPRIPATKGHGTLDTAPAKPGDKSMTDVFRKEGAGVAEKE